MKTTQYTQKIIELFKKGYGRDAICLELKISSGIVAKVLKENNLKRTRAESIEAKRGISFLTRTSEVSIAELKSAMYLHSTTQGIAKLLGVRTSEVKRLKKVYGIK